MYNKYHVAIVHLQRCVILCDPTDYSTPGFPVLHHLPELAQSYVYWVSDAIQPSQSSVISATPFFCFESFPASGSLPMNLPFISGGQSIGASATILPMSIQDWFPLGLTGLSSLLSKGLSRVLSSSTIWKHQFFSIQPSLWSNSHIFTWLLEKP